MTNSRHTPSLKQNESKSMSILSDLDPQNAMIHRNARAASKGNKTVWMLVLLLLSGGAIGLLLTNKSGQHPPATHDTVATAVSTAESSAASVPSNPAPPPATAGAAEIRENTPAQGARKPNKVSEQSALQAMQIEQEQTRGEQPTGNTSLPVSKQKSVATDQRPKAANSVAKPSRNTGKRSTTDGARTAKSEKKPAERDIDIITAIVK